MEVTDVGRRTERKRGGGGKRDLDGPISSLLFLCVKVVFTQMSFLELL